MEELLGLFFALVLSISYGIFFAFRKFPVTFLVALCYVPAVYSLLTAPPRTDSLGLVEMIAIAQFLCALALDAAGSPAKQHSSLRHP